MSCFTLNKKNPFVKNATTTINVYLVSSLQTDNLYQQQKALYETTAKLLAILWIVKHSHETTCRVKTYELQEKQYTVPAKSATKAPMKIHCNCKQHQ